MQGVIVYRDKKGSEKLYYFTGMKYGENVYDFLRKRNIEFSEIIECNTED